MSDIIYYKNGEETFRISPPTVGTKCPETKLEVKKMTNKEQLKVQIQELQEQLQKLEEISPVEEAYKRVYGAYPPTTPSVSNYEDNRWKDFQNGYNASKVSETPQERGERVHKETEELITKIHDGHRVVEYQPIPQEPEELKTLYQMFYENDWNVRSCEVFCDIVKEWMSQYADNVMCGEYKKGYEYCLTVLEENLKND